MTYVLIVMFYTIIGGPQTHPFVAMEHFATEAGCKQALVFVKSTSPTAKAECVVDGKAP